MTVQTATISLTDEYAGSLYRTEEQTTRKLPTLSVEQIINTEASKTLEKPDEEPIYTQATEALLSEVSGVILAVEEEHVKVKIGVNTVVNFPKILFQDKPFASCGQHIKYQIKRDVRGYRYQDFVQDVGQPNPELIAKIHALLDIEP